LELIEACHEILADMKPATVRAVCYQLFTRGLIASMRRNETNRVSRQLTDARESGAIPWAWVVDETRDVEGVATWDHPEDFARAVMRSYRRNKWDAQPCHVEVWSEKGTMRGTLAPVLDEYEVPFRVMHGYASATALHDAALETLTRETPSLVLYVGDWDPSGLQMSEVDLPRLLEEYGAATVVVQRIALTEEDVRDGSTIPSFPTDSKRRDSRWRWYRDRYGPRCWELDALNPVILRERVESAIERRLDRMTWDRYVAAEGVERASIERSVRAWRGVRV
jgi:hypothetical protein